MKRLMIVLVVLATATTAMSQGKFSLGVKLGYNANKLSSDLDSIKAGMKNTFQVGAYARISLGKKAYLQPEIAYQLTKGDINNPLHAYSARNYTLNTIKVPLLFGYKILDLKIANVRVMGGPAFSYYLDKKLDDVKQGEFWPIKSSSDLKNSMWSAQLGIGADVLAFSLDIRYDVGISNIYKGNSDLKLRNNMFNVSLGYKIL